MSSETSVDNKGEFYIESLDFGTSLLLHVLPNIVTNRGYSMRRKGKDLQMERDLIKNVTPTADRWEDSVREE